MDINFNNMPAQIQKSMEIIVEKELAEYKLKKIREFDIEISDILREAVAKLAVIFETDPISTDKKIVIRIKD